MLQPIQALLALALVLTSAAAKGRAETLSAPNRLSLAERYPVEVLGPMLQSREQWHPFPTLRDRAGWAALPHPVTEHLIGLGEDALKKRWPDLPATLYLEFARDGNRSRFEGPYFARREILQDLVLAECAQGKGRFLDAVANALWAICEESTWCLPAHVGAQRAGKGLPDVTEPVVDLFAGETAVTVSWTLYLLGPELDQVSPQVRRRAALELERRVLSPVRERDDFGWMALHVTRPEHRPNNWTPWIAASVLTADLLEELDADRRVQIAHKMLRSLDGFLRFYPADGSCDEGPSYWSRAGGSLLDGLDLLYRATGGRLNVFGEPLIQEIGRFIERSYIGGDYFVAIGDCAARFEPEHDVVFRYGERIQDAGLKALGASGASVHSLLGGQFLGRKIFAVFDAAEILSAASSPPPLLRDVWLPSEDMQLMASRSQAGTTDGLYLAAWGGHNAQSHNHNDVGNFLVFANGRPVLVDVGAPTYTAQTFSSKRYEIWAFQSAFHNLPTINGVMQSAGRPFAARDVVCETNDAFAQLQMDIAPAYPKAAQVKSWVRTVRLNRGRDVEVTERFELSEATSEPTTLNLITPMDADARESGRVMLQTEGAGQGSGLKLQLEYDPAKLTASVERIELTDGRLKRSWGDHLNRLVLRARTAATQDNWRLRLSEVRGKR